jgi:hypothetical protein
MKRAYVEGPKVNAFDSQVGIEVNPLASSIVTHLIVITCYRKYNRLTH